MPFETVTDNLPAQLLKTTAHVASVAIAELVEQVKIDKIDSILFFCSSHYDLTELNKELGNTFKGCHIIGCTTAGEISEQYYSNSLVALVLSSKFFKSHSALIDDVKSFHLSNAMKVASQLESNLIYSEHFDEQRMFGFLLTDGLSLKEENVTSLLNQVMGDLNIIGGSAGDDLDLNQTFIYSNNQFQSNAAVLLIIEVKDDFDVFKMQSFIPTEKELITTEVDFEQRIVNEINGEAAAVAYANINELNVENLSTIDFAMFPLMLKIADEWYIRSISNVNEDHSLQFHCAIDNGLPLRIAKGTGILKRLKEEVERVQSEFKEIYFTLGCDCILRRIEVFDKKYTFEIEKLLKSIKFIGFNSYGEQYNGVHFNQTLVGVVVGIRNERESDG